MAPFSAQSDCAAQLKENTPSSGCSTSNRSLEMPKGKVQTLTERFESVLPRPPISTSDASALQGGVKRSFKMAPRGKPQLQFHPLVEPENNPDLKTCSEDNAEDPETAFWHEQSLVSTSEKDSSSNNKASREMEKKKFMERESMALDEFIRLADAKIKIQIHDDVEDVIDISGETADSVVESLLRCTPENLPLPPPTSPKCLRSPSCEPSILPLQKKSDQVEPSGEGLHLANSTEEVQSVVESFLSSDSEDLIDIDVTVHSEPITEVIERLRTASPEVLPTLLKKEWKRARLREANRELQRETDQSQTQPASEKVVKFTETVEVYFIESNDEELASVEEYLDTEDFLFPGDCRASPEIFADYLSGFLSDGREKGSNPVKEVFSFLYSTFTGDKVKNEVPKEVVKGTGIPKEVALPMERTRIEVTQSDLDDNWPEQGSFSEILSNRSGAATPSRDVFQEVWQDTAEVESQPVVMPEAPQTPTPTTSEFPLHRSHSEPITWGKTEDIDDAKCALTMPPLTSEEIWSSFDPAKTACDSPTDVAKQLEIDASFHSHEAGFPFTDAKYDDLRNQFHVLDEDWNATSPCP